MQQAPAGDHRLPESGESRDGVLFRERFVQTASETHPYIMTTEQRIIHLVEKDWQKIAEQAVRRVQQDPETPNYKSLTDDELRARARDLLANLGQWLDRQDDGLLDRRYEELGRMRHQDGFPLHEVVYKLQLLKCTILNHAREHHLEMNAMELYAEQEFLQKLDLFFDRIIYRVVKGYSEHEMANQAGARPAPALMASALSPGRRAA